MGESSQPPVPSSSVSDTTQYSYCLININFLSGMFLNLVRPSCSTTSIDLRVRPLRIKYLVQANVLLLQQATVDLDINNVCVLCMDLMCHNECISTHINRFHIKFMAVEAVRASYCEMDKLSQLLLVLMVRGISSHYGVGVIIGAPY